MGAHTSIHYSFQEAPGHAIVSGPVCTALMRQGRSVARAAGPRHHRPWLRHRTRRRDAASAASRPRNTHARTDGSVCLSTQPPAERSVQRLILRRRVPAPCRLGNALEQPLRLASPRCPQRAPTHSCLQPAPVPASPCPGTVDGAVGLARWLLPRLPSHGGSRFRLAPGYEPGLQLARCARSSQAPPALDAPTQGLASILVVRCAITALLWGCAVLPVCERREQALRVQAGHARAWWSWRELAHTLGVRHPQTPARPKRIVVRLVFYCRAVCCRVASRASAPAQAASGPAGEAGGSSALPCVPWQPQAAAGCGCVFSSLEGHAM
jgi:hypothetical protein